MTTTQPNVLFSSSFPNSFFKPTPPTNLNEAVTDVRDGGILAGASLTGGSLTTSVDVLHAMYQIAENGLQNGIEEILTSPYTYVLTALSVGAFGVFKKGIKKVNLGERFIRQNQPNPESV